MRNVFLLLILLITTIGCQHHEPIDPLPTWQRFFPGDERLVGVRVQQHPDNGDIESHQDKHPAMVLYVFKKQGKHEVCQVGFTPNGDIDELFWWGPPHDWVMEQLKPHPRR